MLFKTAKEMLEEHGRKSTILECGYWLEVESETIELNGTNAVQFIWSYGDWEIGIGEQSTIVNEAMCGRIVFALICKADLIVIRDLLAEFSESEAI